MASEAPTHYDLLAVARSATAEQIRQAYRRMALLHHPDKGGHEARFKLVGRAYEVLQDPESRARYDRELASEAAAAAAAKARARRAAQGSPRGPERPWRVQYGEDKVAAATQGSSDTGLGAEGTDG